MKISAKPVGKKARSCNEPPEHNPEELGNDGCAESVGFMRGLPSASRRIEFFHSR